MSRLKLLKASHQSNQYRLEDNLLRYFPQNIEMNKGFVKALEQDLKTLSENTPPDGEFLPMIIKCTTLKDKESAGTAILKACKTLADKEVVEIGNYRGFTKQLSFDSFLKEFQVTLKGAMRHTAKLGTGIKGNILRIDNALANIRNKLNKVKNQLNNLYKQQEATKLELGKTFLQ